MTTAAVAFSGLAISRISKSCHQAGVVDQAYDVSRHQPDQIIPSGKYPQVNGILAKSRNSPSIRKHRKHHPENELKQGDGPREEHKSERREQQEQWNHSAGQYPLLHGDQALTRLIGARHLERPVRGELSREIEGGAQTRDQHELKESEAPPAVRLEPGPG